ncbi:MAG: cyclodeaminase/cyclohydrolase family protein [Mycobacterium leprae]
MRIGEQSVASFCSALAAGTPTPGGGAAAAVAGAIGASLVTMVAGLTAGREKYAEVNDEMISLQEVGRREIDALLNCADRDGAAYDKVMAALALPKETAEEKTVRRQAVQAGYQEATLSPLDTMRHALTVMRSALAAATRGNSNALSDANVGYLTASAAFEGGLWNVAINIGSLKDETFKGEVLDEVAKLRAGRQEVAQAFEALTPDPVARFLDKK